MTGTVAVAEDAYNGSMHQWGAAMSMPRCLTYRYLVVTSVSLDGCSHFDMISSGSVSKGSVLFYVKSAASHRVFGLVVLLRCVAIGYRLLRSASRV